MGSMKVDKELIKRVATVARLELTGEEEIQFVEDFKEILDAFSKIEEVDTSGLERSCVHKALLISLRFPE